MKRARRPVFFIVALLTLVFTFVSIVGVYSFKGDTKTTYAHGVGDIRWGIDINGGVEATFTPDNGGKKASTTQLDAAKAVIETRLVQNKITDYELESDYNHQRIIVRFPWQSGETSFNPEEAIKELSATAVLTFREGSEYSNTTVDDNGESVQTTPKGTTAENIILEGKDVSAAKASLTQNETTGATEYVVDLELTEEGGKKFAAGTKKVANADSTISIWMDDTMISSASVDKAKFGKDGITGGKATISGNFTSEEATKLANQINSGALPFKLNSTGFNTLSPSLGASSLQAMALALVIGFALVCAFMIVMYRLPGFVACISLCGQMALCFAAVTGFFPFMQSFTLTLPGLAGIILSIGMGVDANIITATRIKEEIHAGKSIDAALKAGNDNSFWAIFDGNVATIIVSVILMLVFGPSNILSYFFGASTTGAIYSFGFTLLIGNIGNFIFGVYTTRMMTKSLSAFKCLRKKWLFGGPVRESHQMKTFHVAFSQNKRIYFAVSIALLVVGVVMNFVFGSQLSTEFRGGTSIKYAYTGQVQQGEVEKIAEDVIKDSVTIRLNSGVKQGTELQDQISVSLAGASITPDTQKALADALQKKYPGSTFAVVESSSTEPSMGLDFFKKCMVAVAIVVLLLICYIAFRFRKIGGSAAGVMSIVALLHDVAMVYFSYVVFQIPIDGQFIAVVLTILGYSLNGTIIIYDRVRENRSLMPQGTPVSRIVDTSINQTLTRSVNTALCTFMAIACVFVVGTVFNLPSVTSFALPMMVGIVSGCYSSTCLAGPLYVLWENRKGKKQGPAPESIPAETVVE